MQKIEYLSKVNSKNIPGYNEEELNELFSFNSDGCDIYKLDKCPVCNKPYISNTICLFCGHDDNSDNTQEYKEWYTAYKKEHSDFIWVVENENK